MPFRREESPCLVGHPFTERFCAVLVRGCLHNHGNVAGLVTPHEHHMTISNTPPQRNKKCQLSQFLQSSIAACIPTETARRRTFLNPLCLAIKWHHSFLVLHLRRQSYSSIANLIFQYFHVFCNISRKKLLKVSL